MTRDEMKELGWDELDILLVSGDAYIDHPACAVAILGRWLCENGFRVGVVAQPSWNDTADFTVMGSPRLFVGISAGSLDSMLAHYTAFRKKRSEDAYTPGGKAGARPNRATIVYAGLVKQAFSGVPVVIGGIEASLRRATHYDFWTDKMRRSILLDSKADLLIYGMGELPILEIARRLDGVGDIELREKRKLLVGISGTVYAGKRPNINDGCEVNEIPSHEEIVADPKQLMRATVEMEKHAHQGGYWLMQKSGGREVYFAPPAAILATEELDRLYSLPFRREAHPSYSQDVPAMNMIRFSITAHRGCGGGCSFCSLALHQRRLIRSRSRESLQKEARSFTRHPNWDGSITDVGGPTANMWAGECVGDYSKCERVSCLYPNICRNFKVQQQDYLRLLRELRGLSGVSSLRVASGVRFDLALENTGFACDLVAEFVGGQLKLAPEHTCENVLCFMRKPKNTVFEKFIGLFDEECRRSHKRQYIIPYLISAFPGCSESDMRELKKWLDARGWQPKQVQCFIPTPGTVATAMFAGGIDSQGNGIYVAKSDSERMRQHAILVGEWGGADASAGQGGKGKVNSKGRQRTEGRKRRINRKRRGNR